MIFYCRQTNMKLTIDCYEFVTNSLCNYATSDAILKLTVFRFYNREKYGDLFWIAFFYFYFGNLFWIPSIDLHGPTCESNILLICINAIALCKLCKLQRNICAVLAILKL